MSTEEFIGFVIVFAIAMIENIAAIPIGLFMGIDPLGVLIAGTAGALAMMLIALVLGDRVGRWVTDDEGRAARMESVRERSRAKIDKYGAASLALIGPLVTGVHVGTVLAILLECPRGRSLCGWASASSESRSQRPSSVSCREASSEPSRSAW